MKSEGYGGGPLVRENEHILDGVRTDGAGPAGAHYRTCASRYCDREFLARQDGDYFCSERCDLDARPDFAAGRAFEDIENPWPERSRAGYSWNERPSSGFAGRKRKDGRR